MYRPKFLLLIFAAMLFSGLLWGAKHPLIAAYAAGKEKIRSSSANRIGVKREGGIVPTVQFHPVDPRPTPGQLTILNPQGQPGGLCPLQGTQVNADIAGFVARVTVTQQFVNPSNDAIEAVYTFPLPEDAAVDDMTMTLGSRVIKGEIKKREEARQIYEAAKSEGKAASLLDQERPNIFTQSVANIMPGDPITITISYVNLLKYDEGRYEFSYPMVVGPRYMPNGGGYTVPGKRGDPSPPTTGTPLPLGTGSGPVLRRDILSESELQPGSASGSNATTGGIEGTVHAHGPTPSAQPIQRNHLLVKPTSPKPSFTPPVPPSDGLPARVVTDADKITPPITPPGTRAGHDISITVTLDAGVPVQNISSVLHPIEVNKTGPNKAVIHLKDQNTIPNKDFILRYTVGGNQVQTGVLTTSRGSGDGYFTLIMQPPLAPPQSVIAPKEMVFVIDQTGSQGGWPIKKAKETMAHCIKNMNPGDTFQLIGFNTDIYPCFPAPVANTPQNVQKALSFLEPIEGSGGTDILKSVDYALKLPEDPNRLRIICYMTDGYVGNDMQIIDYIQKHRGDARMFPFGVGNSVNRFLIEGMAKEGRGASDYVTLDEPGQNCATKFYNRIASPILLDPQVDFSGLPVTDVYPKHIPDVFSSGPIILKGRYTKAAEGDVIVRGIFRGKPWSQRIHVNLPAVDKDGGALATIWARQKIEELQSQDWMGAQSGQPNPNIQNEIIQTALQYRLMSEYTSFVAVEERVINVSGKSHKLDVPVEMPEGVSYEGIFGERNEGLQANLSAGATRYSRSRGMVAAKALSVPALQSPAPQSYAANGSLSTLNRSPNSPVVTGGASASQGGGGFGGTVLRESLSDSLEEKEFGFNGVTDSEIAAGDKKALDKLKDLKPEDRKQLVSRIKLDASLLGLAAKVKADGHNRSLDKAGVPKVSQGQVTVQIWLNRLTADDLKKLKTLGFKLDATLIPKKLLLGTVAMDKLDELADLTFVRRVEPPKFK